MNMLRNLKITQKLVLIFGITLLGFGAVALAYMTVLDVNVKAAKKLDRLTTFGNNVEAARVELLEAQRDHDRFLVLKDLQYVKSFENKMTLLRDKLVELGNQPIEGMNPNTLDNVKEGLRSYHAIFYIMAEEKMGLGLDENTGLQGEFRAAAHKVEDLLKQAHKPTLTSSLLMMRRHEKDFLLRGDDKYIEKMAVEKKHFARLLKVAKFSTKTKSKIRGLMGIYHGQFLAMVGNIRRLAQANIGLDNTVIQLEPLLTSLLREKDTLLAVNNQRIAAKQDLITWIFMGILGVIGTVLLLTLFMFSRGITRSLSRLRNTVAKVGEGDFGARAQLVSRDELGELGNAFDGLLDERLSNLSQADKENEKLNNSVIGLLDAVSQLSDRDLTATVPVTEDVTGPVADAMNMMAKETAQVLSQIREVAQEVELAANTVKQQGDKITDVAAGERQLVGQTMIKLEEAAKTMTDIASLAQACNQLAERASGSTDKALETVNNTVGGMNEIRETISETEKRIKRLGERSQEITGIVEIINDIAERTHVLALNASMQAAAAGEAGRGFAVVADEVQRLAESSRNSTSQISALVNNIQTETSETMATMNKTISQVVEGSEFAEKAGQEMVETQQNTAELVSTVNQIAERSSLQAQVSNQLRDEAVTIQGSTQQTAEEIEQQTVQTQNLVQYAKRLLESVHVFKLPEKEKKGNWPPKRAVGN